VIVSQNALAALFEKDQRLRKHRIGLDIRLGHIITLFNLSVSGKLIEFALMGYVGREPLFKAMGIGRFVFTKKE
jgi:hypothetical protein